MILRDPVHGLVSFEGRREQLVESLLSTRELQRLRRVRQLGLASLVFPGAEHSRFAHAVGAAHVMGRLLARLAEAPRVGEDLDEASQDDAVAAALLHDLGHGPFSHLFEDVLPRARHHEAWTVDALRDDGTEVHRALESWRRGMSEDVAQLLEGKHRHAYLASAVSGTLDVDRMDYLVRDSHMTGVSYGLYDLDWLLRALTLTEVGGEPRISVEGRKGVPPVESFFLGRHHMYQQVYHHKAVRAGEAVVRGLFARLAELVHEGRGPSALPRAIETAIVGGTVSVGSYFELDDAVLLAASGEWERHDDALLSGFARALRGRQLPKTVPLPIERPDLWAEVHERASRAATALGLRADLHVHLDVAVDMPFPESDDDTKTGLLVALRHHAPQRLGDVSFVLRELRNKRVERPRLIFPAELRADLERILGETGAETE
jgi:uncharacterized protein